MRAYQLFNGGEIYSAREYDIASATEIKEGQIVKLSEGLVVAASTTETGAILGIAAENHSGSADALDPRANGTKIKVYDAEDLVMACPAVVVEATGGSTTTVTTDELGAYSADDWNGGYLKLVAKAANSTNADPIGTVKRITDYAYAASGTVSTFTVATGATAVDGDKFELYPPMGLAKFALDSSIKKVVATGVSATSLKACGRIESTSEVLYKAASHF